MSIATETRAVNLPEKLRETGTSRIKFFSFTDYRGTETTMGIGTVIFRTTIKHKKIQNNIRRAAVIVVYGGHQKVRIYDPGYLTL